MRRYKTNEPDRKSKDGSWVRTFSIGGVKHTTRAFALWNNLNSRVANKYDGYSASYVECSNMFKDFQEFAEWANVQYGYMHKDENGRFWQLDKDLLFTNNKEYTPNNCIFIPQRINLIISKSFSVEGELPVGVSYYSSKAIKYEARCRDGMGGKGRLGIFDNIEDAHKEWQKAKIQVVDNLLLTDEVKSHVRLHTGLLEFRDRISNDLLLGKIT